MDQQTNQTDTETSADGWLMRCQRSPSLLFLVAVVYWLSGCRPSTPVSQRLEANEKKNCLGRFLALLRWLLTALLWVNFGLIEA